MTHAQNLDDRDRQVAREFRDLNRRVPVGWALPTSYVSDNPIDHSKDNHQQVNIAVDRGLNQTTIEDLSKF